MAKPKIPGAAFNKFKVSPKEDRTWNRQIYASKLEMNFHKELLEHFSPEQIHLQVPFVLQEGFRLSFDQELRRPIRYVTDFVIGERPEGNNISPGSVVIDSKGMRTPEFNIIKKLFERASGHPIWLLKSVKQLKLQIPIIKLMQTVNKDIVKTLTDGPFTVKGYRSSDGTVADKTFQIIGRDGYLDLVRQSIEELETEFIKLEAECAPLFTAAMMRQGCDSLNTSLQKKLEEPKEPETGEAVQITPAIGYHEGKEDHFIILRLQLLQQEITTTIPSKPKNPSATLFKNLLQARLPIDSYVHRINLYPGKYESVTPA